MSLFDDQAQIIEKKEETKKMHSVGLKQVSTLLRRNPKQRNKGL